MVTTPERRTACDQDNLLRLEVFLEGKIMDGLTRRSLSCFFQPAARQVDVLASPKLRHTIKYY
jgi:hypothetical protein